MTSTTLTPAEEQAQAALAATPTADLLTKAFALTHQMHESDRDRSKIQHERQRGMRDLIQAEILRRTGDLLAQRLESWIRHGEAVPAHVTTYDRSIVNAELRALVEEARRG